MDGNSAKKAPVLDHLVGTTNAPSGNKPAPSTEQKTQAKAKPVLASMNGNGPSTGVTKNSAFRDPSGKPIPSAIIQPGNPNQQNNNPQPDNLPQNRRTDKSEFEIELARTLTKLCSSISNMLANKLCNKYLVKFALASQAEESNPITAKPTAPYNLIR